LTTRNTYVMLANREKSIWRNCLQTLSLAKFVIKFTTTSVAW